MVENPPANSGEVGSIPGQGTKILRGAQRGQKIKVSLKEKIKIKKQFLGSHSVKARGDLTVHLSHLHNPLQAVNTTCLLRAGIRVPHLLLLRRMRQRSALDFSGGSVVKNLPANAGDMSSIPRPQRFHMPQSNYARAPQVLSLCSRARGHSYRSPGSPGSTLPSKRNPPTTATK